MYKKEIADRLRERGIITVDQEAEILAAQIEKDHAEALRIKAERNHIRACVISMLTYGYGLKRRQARNIVNHIDRGILKSLSINYEGE